MPEEGGEYISRNQSVIIRSVCVGASGDSVDEDGGIDYKLESGGAIGNGRERIGMMIVIMRTLGLRMVLEA